MIIPAPPHPVTLSYIGVCAGVSGGAARAVYALLPRGWRYGKSFVPLIIGLLGGLYGTTIWTIALFGGLSRSARVSPMNGDLLSVIVGAGGIGGLLGALAGLFARWGLANDVTPSDWADIGVGTGLLFGLGMWLLIPGLHS